MKPTQQIMELARVLQQAEIDWIRRDTDTEHYPDNPENPFVFMAQQIYLYFERKQDIR